MICGSTWKSRGGRRTEQGCPWANNDLLTRYVRTSWNAPNTYFTKELTNPILAEGATVRPGANYLLQPRNP
jgi:hypothetical protein